MSDSGYSVGAWLIMIVFMCSLGFIVISYLNTPHFKPASLFLPIITMMLVIMALYEYMIVVHGRRFKWITGPYGTMHGPIDFAVPGPYFRSKVWINKHVYDRIGNKAKLKVQMNGIMGFMGMLNNSVLVEFQGQKNLIRDYGQQCELKEGEYVYMGSISGFTVRSEDEVYRQQVERLQFQLSNLHSYVETQRAQLDGLSKISDKGLINASTSMDKILKDLTEARKPLNEQPAAAMQNDSTRVI